MVRLVEDGDGGTGIAGDDQCRVEICPRPTARLAVGGSDGCDDSGRRFAFLLAAERSHV